MDDATGTVAQAVFRTTEDTRGYLVLQEGLVQQWGIPLALYSDRHAAFKYNARQKPVPVETTQFARVMRELGIQQIFALSPQAKGRVERMLETFQDRLVTELRLADASTIDQASLVLAEFLPRFNVRFAVAAEQPETAYRPLLDELSLTETICLNDTRKYPCWMSSSFAGLCMRLPYSACGTQGVFRRATAFRSSSNLRITATNATLPGFPH